MLAGIRCMFAVFRLGYKLLLTWPIRYLLMWKQKETRGNIKGNNRLYYG
jgi:hypothetical protein